MLERRTIQVLVDGYWKDYEFKYVKAGMEFKLFEVGGALLTQGTALKDAVRCGTRGMGNYIIEY